MLCSIYNSQDNDMTSYAYAYFQTQTALGIFEQVLADQNKLYEVEPVMGGYCVMWTR